MPCKVSHDRHILLINAYAIILIIFVFSSECESHEGVTRKEGKEKKAIVNGGATMW